MSCKLGREVDHWVRLYEQGHINYAMAVSTLASLGCGDEDIARLIGPDPDTGDAPRAKFIALGI